MATHDDYLRLRKSFPHQPDHQPFPITIAELADILCFTPRNVQIILKKMVQEGWIHFSPGRGRGHQSSLSFEISLEDMILQKGMEWVKQGEVQKGLNLFEEFQAGLLAKQKFLDWVVDYFGYRVERAKEGMVKVLRFPLFRTIQTLDPAYVFFTLDKHLIRQVYNTLVFYNERNGQIEGELAHDWDVDDQGTLWRFYLRRGVFFHHGKECTAEDVAYTFRRLQDPQTNSPAQWLIRQLKEINIISDRVIEFQLYQPNHLFLRVLAASEAAIVPCDFKGAPIGTGPFHVAKKNEGICILEAFPHYFQPRAHLDKIEIFLMTNEQLEQIQPTFNLMVMNTEEVNPYQTPNWKDKEKLNAGTTLLTVNLVKEGPLQDKRLRKRVSKIIDQEKLVKELAGLRLCPAAGLSFVQKWQREEDRDNFNEWEFHMPLSLYTYQRHAADAYWIQNELKSAGIPLDVHIVSWSDIQHPDTLRAADFTLFEAVLSEGQLSQIEYYQSQQSFIRNHLHDDLKTRLDEAIDALLCLPDPSQRQQALDEMERDLIEDCAVVYLAHKKHGITHHPTVRGVRVNAKGWVDFKDVWFDQTINESL